MRVTIEKLPGVESATVSLNEGRVVIRFRADNTITLAQIREGVERNGFTPQRAVVDAEVQVVQASGRIQLGIAGTRESFDVAVGTLGASIRQQLEAAAGSRIRVEGVVPPQKDRTAAPVMEVTRVGRHPGAL